jgi:O-antigen/teichoic acid export membrane protein
MAGMSSTPRAAGERSHARRLGWGLADQALSSVTNFALSVLVARAVGISSFGAFGLAFTTYSLALGATRAFCSDPMGVRFSATDTETWRRGARQSTGAALVLGTLTGLICAAAALAFTGTLRDSLLALALPMPGLIVQDTWRTAFFSNRRGSSAFANDLMWGVAQVILVGVVWFSGHKTAPMFVLAWGGAANVAAVFGFMQARLLPRPLATWRWLRSMRDLSPRFLVEFTARGAANSGSMYMAGAFGGLAAAGALRGAQVVLGPMNILNMGITAPAITEAVHLSKRSLQRMLQFTVVVGGSLTLASIVFGVGMYFLPDRYGHALLRHSWRPAHHVILAYAVVSAAAGMLTGATVGLRALAAAKRSLRARLITGIVALPATTVGAYLGGANGAAIGLGIALWLGGILWWRSLIDELGTHAIARRAPLPAGAEPAA